MDALWRIELLGQLRAVHADRIITRFRTQKTGALLAYLAYYSQRAHPREELIELLWPEREPQAGRRNLRVELTSLRHQLEPPGLPFGAVLVTDRAKVQLNPMACTPDVALFEAALQQAARTKDLAERRKRLTEAAELYGGELLPGYFEAWIVPERQRLLEAYLQGLGMLIALLEQAGELQEALQWARRAVSAEPLREEGHQAVMRLLAGTGQPEAALRQYREVERLLREELRAAPEAALRALAREIEARVAQRAGSARSANRSLPTAQAAPTAATVPALLGVQPLPSPASTLCPVDNLPVQFTRFFGREEEIAHLTDVLGSRTPERPRLITLTGPGGSGKTRLALEVAARLRQTAAHSSPSAVWFVSLAELTNPQFIADQALRAFRLARTPHLESFEQWGVALSERPTLLVLDSFEHLLPGGAPLVRMLLERVETLTALVTSRQRLGLLAEREFPVTPLPVPVEGLSLRVEGPTKTTSTGPSTRNPQRSTLAQCASIQLFVDRAQAARPDFQVTKANAAAVAALCQRLEGLPLALELAAARAGVLTPAQMVARLSRRFDLLARRGGEADPRHRSLRAALDWSHRLLPLELQRFFASLSVFRGGFTLAAVEAVCGDCGFGSGAGAIQNATSEIRNFTVLESLQQLRECSLLLAEETSGISGHGAAESSAGGRPVLRRQTDVSRRMSDASGDDTRPLDRAPAPCEAEMRYRLLETLREYGAAQLAPGEQDRLARRHAEYFLRLAEQGSADREAWLEQLTREHDNLRTALDWSLASGEIETSTRLGIALGALWNERHFWAEGRQRLAEILSRLPPHASPQSRAHLLNQAATLAWAQGDFVEARSMRTESVAIWRTLEDRKALAYSLFFLALVVHEQGDAEAAQRLYEESLLIQRERNDRQGIGFALNNLGLLAHEQGDHETARALCEQSLALFRELKDNHAAALSLHNLAEVARYQGDRVTARRLGEESLALRRELVPEDRRCISASFNSLGGLALEEGDLEAARSLYARSLVMRRELGEKRGIAECLGGLARVAARLRQPERAARLFGAVAALREVIGAPLPPCDHSDHQRSLSAVRTALGEPAFAAAWARGRGMRLDQAITAALEIAP
jgi:predicted ATPase/DNA-binding SARP family transcriptional activator